MPFNSWQEIQRGAERREGRGMAYGKWNDSSDQNKLFLVSLGPDPIIRLCQIRQLLEQRHSRWKSEKMTTSKQFAILQTLFYNRNADVCCLRVCRLKVEGQV